MDTFTRMHEMAGRQKIILAGAAGAVIKDGKILLVQRNNLGRTWGIPGGVQELGEPIRETARREIQEEVGLDMRAGDLIGVYSESAWDVQYPDGFCIQQMALFFLMEGEAGEINIQPEEVADWGFFAADELPENMMPCCRQKVQDWAAYQGKPVIR